MIEPSTKTISRLQVIRDRAAAREMAKATEQGIEKGTEKGARQGARQGAKQEPMQEIDPGSLEGEARALIKRMIASGLRLTEAQRRQVMACTDPSQMALWSERAATAGSVAAVLARRPVAKSGRG